MKASDKLRVTYSKRERDLMMHYPLGFMTKNDGHYLANTFSKAFTDELTQRGYDITTMKFSIEPLAGQTRFAAQRIAAPESE